MPHREIDSPSSEGAQLVASLLARIDGLMAQIAGRDERIDELLAQVGATPKDGPSAGVAMVTCKPHTERSPHVTSKFESSHPGRSDTNFDGREWIQQLLSCTSVQCLRLLKPARRLL